VPESEKARSTKLGVCKINQGMDSQMAHMAVDPAPAERAGRDAMRVLIAERMVCLGQAGQALRHRG
jgi:fructose-bisphosphate aldolase, class II